MLHGTLFEKTVPLGPPAKAFYKYFGNFGDQASYFILFSEDGQTRLDVRWQNETVWLSLNQLAELFQRDKSVISRHIKNIFEEGELLPEATVAKFATVHKII